MIESKKKALKLKEMGNDVFKLKRYEVAEKFYTKALELNLDSRPVWTNRATCRNTMKKHEDALADCLSAVQILHCPLTPKILRRVFELMKSRSFWLIVGSDWLCAPLI